MKTKLAERKWTDSGQTIAFSDDGYTISNTENPDHPAPIHYELIVYDHTEALSEELNQRQKQANKLLQEHAPSMDYDVKFEPPPNSLNIEVAIKAESENAFAREKTHYIHFSDKDISQEEYATIRRTIIIDAVNSLTEVDLLMSKGKAKDAAETIAINLKRLANGARKTQLTDSPNVDITVRVTSEQRTLFEGPSKLESTLATALLAVQVRVLTGGGMMVDDNGLGSFKIQCPAARKAQQALIEKLGRMQNASRKEHMALSTVFSAENCPDDEKTQIKEIQALINYSDKGNHFFSPKIMHQMIGKEAQQQPIDVVLSFCHNDGSQLEEGDEHISKLKAILLNELKAHPPRPEKKRKQDEQVTPKQAKRTSGGDGAATTTGVASAASMFGGTDKSKVPAEEVATPLSPGAPGSDS